MADVFQPWRSGSDAAGARNMGLGLYIVRQIVDAHGGTIAVQSTLDAGTTFSAVFDKDGPAPV